MIKKTENYKEEAKAAIVNSANILLSKADELARDVDELKVSGISIWISLEPGEQAQLDITKTYMPL